MQRALIISSVLFVSGFGSCLSAADGDYWVRVAPAIWQADFDGDISHAESGLIGADEYGADQLGIDNDETSFALEASLSLPILFDIHAGFSRYDTDGGTRLDETIVVEDQAFAAGTDIDTAMELNDLYGEIAWRILPVPGDFAGVSVGLALHQMDAAFSVSDGVRSAGFDETLYLPALAVRGYLQPIGSVRLDGRVHYLNASLGDYEGTFADVDLRVVYQPYSLIGFGLGYRHQLYDLTIEDVGDVDEAQTDLTLGGPYLTVVARF